MEKFNLSEEGKAYMSGLLKPKVSEGMEVIYDALKNGIVKKTPGYKNLKQEIGIKEVRNGGKELVLTDDSRWEAKEKRGLNSEHAKYWDKKQTVIVKLWDETYDDYIVVNLPMNDKSCWSFIGFEEGATE